MFEQYSYRWFFTLLIFLLTVSRIFYKYWIEKERFISARYAFGTPLFLLHIFLYNLISLEVCFLSWGTLPSILRHNVYPQESYIHIVDKAICMRIFVVCNESKISDTEALREGSLSGEECLVSQITSSIPCFLLYIDACM